jgi:hypothetical protein
MSSDSDFGFVTQSTFSQRVSDVDTDTVLDDILDIQTSKVESNRYDLKCMLFSDVSDDEKTDTAASMPQAVIPPTAISTRFAVPKSDTELKSIGNDRFAPRTEAKSQWVLRAFSTWQENRNEMAKNRTDVKFVHGDILSMDAETLDYAVGAFAYEVRKDNGEEYRGQTLFEMVIAIQHHLRQHGRFVTIMDDEQFLETRNLLDKKMKELAAKGIGIEKRQAEVVSLEMENTMWEKGVLGMDTPGQLRDTLFFLIGLNFALRGGDEQYNLRVGANSQLAMKIDEKGNKYLQYTEDVSKCNKGGILHRKLDRKCTRAYGNTKNPERCIIRVYEKYMSLR